MTREEEIRARLENATPGPWGWQAGPRGTIDLLCQSEDEQVRSMIVLNTDPDWITDDDKALISNAPSDIDYLLKDNEFKSTLLEDAEAQVDYLLKENQRLRGALKDACSEVHGWFGGTQEGYDITEKIIKALEGEQE